MALDLKPEEKAVGTANFQRAVGKLGVTRREFLQGMLAAGSALPLGAAAYYGYDAAFGERPVRAALIGAGDEGGVLVGEHNPRFLEFVAYSDIRPYNQNRIFEGEPTGARKGFNFHYGSRAKDRIKLETNYKALLERSDIEAVVIALPLNLHAEVAIAAMKKGKHVLCEKLMAWDVKQCKEMIAAAESTEGTGKPRVLSIGHQRHYSMLYAHANEVVKSGVLGDVRHIRAQWHRNNVLPRLDANGQPRSEIVNGQRIPMYRDSWRPELKSEDAGALAAFADGTKPAGDWKDVNELVRWRLYNRTGGGLMAELGSHQLDACSIFLAKPNGEKVMPIAVTAAGGKHFYKDDRQVNDHVYCIFEFPGGVTVTYSSISTNGFEPYGECVMGSQGTLIVEKEEAAYLYGQGNRSTSMTVAAGGALSASSTTPDAGDRRAQDLGQQSLGTGTPSRGYREEMEHFAWIIRKRAQGMDSDLPQLTPRCDGHAALGDAIMALTANIAMREQKRIPFHEDWFKASLTNRTPEADYPARRR